MIWKLHFGNKEIKHFLKRRKLILNKRMYFKTQLNKLLSNKEFQEVSNKKIVAKN